MNKKYLIAGATSEIGQDLIKKLLTNGNSVTTISRTKKELENVTSHECDICNWQVALPDIEGPFSGLVYLPGTINLHPFRQLSIDDFRNDMEINYLGAVRVIQTYLPQLVSEPNSSIVLISSVAASLGLFYHASIASAKAAVEGLGISLAAELAPKIRVNIVAPSITKTPLSEKLLDSETKIENMLKKHPLQMIGQPSDIANAIHYLLSEESRWITGQVLHVDGGFSNLKPL